MTKRPLWVVLAPGKRETIEQRVYQYFEDLQPDAPSFSFHSGDGDYHAIYGTDEISIGLEGQLAEELSTETTQPVYALDLSTDEQYILAFQNRECEVEERDSDELARSLGCPLPELNVSSAFPSMTVVAVIEGLGAEQAKRILEEEQGSSLPLTFHFEETSKGLLLYSDTGDIGFADITISEHFPEAIVYGVIASSNFNEFTVRIFREGESIGHYNFPPYSDSSSPSLGNIKGETRPEQILEVLGIPVELFMDNITRMS